MVHAPDDNPHMMSRIHDAATTKKNECFFVGFLDGILANERLDITELEPLLAECEAICRRVNDDDAAEIIREANAGHANTIAELLDLCRQIAEVRTNSIDPSCKRSSANRILGFCAGVNCDSIITTREAKSLLERIDTDHDLSDDPRIDALRICLADGLEDGVIDPPESSEISSLITALVGDSYADTGIPSSDTIPVIHDLDEIEISHLAGLNVMLTGTFAFGTRTEVSDRLAEFEMTVLRQPSRKVDLVIIGSDGSPHWTHQHHGGKLAKAMQFRKEGPAPRIFLETQMKGILL